MNSVKFIQITSAGRKYGTCVYGLTADGQVWEYGSWVREADKHQWTGWKHLARFEPDKPLPSPPDPTPEELAQLEVEEMLSKS